MSTKNKTDLHFHTTARENVPSGRKGKHSSIVTAIFKDLDTLAPGQALKIPLHDLPDTKVNIRSALSRASRNARRNVSTAADGEFLYIWNS